MTTRPAETGAAEVSVDPLQPKVTATPSTSAPDTIPNKWRTIVQALNRPYPVSVPMVVLVSLVPFYIFLARIVANRPLHAPVLVLDSLLPLQPAWALVYGSVYLFLILLQCS